MKKNIYIFILCISFILCGCTKDNFPEESNNDIPAELKDYIFETIELSDDKEIEYQEWLNADKTCYRVAIEYKEEQDDIYKHSEDYFFFLTGDDIDYIYVDYSNASVEDDRYVWNACDFQAYFEDVTFDGNQDLIISLGHSGSGGDLVYCAYVYKDGKYIYTKSFETIVNYTIDNHNKSIVCTDNSGKVFRYDGREFVEQ